MTPASLPIQQLARQQAAFAETIRAAGLFLDGLAGPDIDAELDGLQQRAWAPHARMEDQRLRFGRIFSLIGGLFAPVDQTIEGDLAAALDLREPESASALSAAEVQALESHPRGPAIVRESLAEGGFLPQCEAAEEDVKHQTAPLALPAAPEEVTASAANKPIESATADEAKHMLTHPLMGQDVQDALGLDSSGAVKEVQADAAARGAASPEERVKAVHPDARLQEKDAAGGKKYRIIRPIGGGGSKPLSGWCKSAAEAWESAAAKLPKPKGA